MSTRVVRVSKGAGERVAREIIDAHGEVEAVLSGEHVAGLCVPRAAFAAGWPRVDEGGLPDDEIDVLAYWEDSGALRVCHVVHRDGSAELFAQDGTEPIWYVSDGPACVTAPSHWLDLEDLEPAPPPARGAP